MEGRIIREVSYRTWDEAKQDYRDFSGAMHDGGDNNERKKVEVCADGESFDIAVDDIPLLVKVLQDFYQTVKQ